GVVALEDAAVDGVAIDAGEVALEEEAMAQLAAAESGLDAAAADGADQDLAGDAQQRAALVAPRLVLARADAEDADRHAVVEQRHGEDGAVPRLLVRLALRGRLGGELGQAHTEVFAAGQAVERPGEGLD